MKDTPFESRPYRVTVSGIVTTTVSVFAESEDDAIAFTARTDIDPSTATYLYEIVRVPEE